MNNPHKVIALSVLMLSIPVGLYFSDWFNDEKNNDRELSSANLAGHQNTETAVPPLIRQRRSADIADSSPRGFSPGRATRAEPEQAIQDESGGYDQQPEPHDPWQDLTTPAKFLAEQFELIDAGDNLSLALPDNPYFSLPVATVSYTPRGAKVIAGGQQLPGGGSSFLITAGKDISFGTVVTPDGSYSLSIVDGETSIIKKDSDVTPLDCHQPFSNQ